MHLSFRGGVLLELSGVRQETWPTILDRGTKDGDVNFDGVVDAMMLLCSDMPGGAPEPVMAVQPAGRPRAKPQGRPRRAHPDTECWGCKQKGHWEEHCPNKNPSQCVVVWSSEPTREGNSQQQSGTSTAILDTGCGRTVMGTVHSSAWWRRDRLQPSAVPKRLSSSE